MLAVGSPTPQLTAYPNGIPFQCSAASGLQDMLATGSPLTWLADTLVTAALGSAREVGNTTNYLYTCRPFY